MTEQNHPGQNHPDIEFSRPVSIVKLGAGGAHHRIAPTDAERAALAKRFGFVSLDHLEALIHITRAGAGVRVVGTIDARLAQHCVVSLLPVPETVSASFASRFLPGIDEDEADRLALEEPSEEIIEPLMGDFVDIGELVAQELSVAVEPYPRAPDVTIAPHLVADDDADDGDERRPNPFDALAALKK